MPRHARTTVLALVLPVALTALAVPASATGNGSARHIMGRHRRHAGAEQQSLNWAGYIRPGHDLTSLHATWTVPRLTSTHDGFSSTWVGIDGATSGDGYLIQTGTEADVSGGRRSYDAWWEVITPTDEAPETLFPQLAVSPGDSVSAVVEQVSSGRWSVRLTDNTSGHTASHTASFSGPGSSAEWIQEDTDVNSSISTAPDWGSVTFRRLELDGAGPHLKPTEAVDIVDSHGTRETSTSAPSASGSGFTVSWLATGTKTPAG